ncbi:hypothetical protein KC316_g13969, partial [Hortaea werneckii]
MVATDATGRAPSAGIGSGDGVYRTLSNSLSRTFSRRTTQHEGDSSSEDETSISKADDWKLMPEIKEFKQQDDKDQIKGRKLGVTWKDLTVKGIGADAAF